MKLGHAALVLLLALLLSCSSEGAGADGGLDGHLTDYAKIEGPVTTPIVDLQPSPDAGPPDLQPSPDAGPPDLLLPQDAVPIPDVWPVMDL